jgi:hypothetical protein
VDGEAHPGCKCPDDFEGQHCQYLKGFAPEEDKGQPYLMVPGEKSDSGRAEGIVVFIIIIVVAGVVMGMGYVIYLKKRRSAGGTGFGAGTRNAGIGRNAGASGALAATGTQADLDLGVIRSGSGEAMGEVI